MKKFRFLISLLLSALILCALCGTAFADDGGFVIRDYNVQAVMHNDNSVTVTENISVDFLEARHGIYRTIPEFMYIGGAVNGTDSSKAYRSYVSDVYVAGAPAEFYAEDSSYFIKIGDPDYTVTGDKNYTISYTYRMSDDRIDELDLLYYSVLGADWDTYIDNFSFTMSFDKPLPASALDGLRVFSGERGQEENLLNIAVNVSAEKISGHAQHIAPQQAITLFSKLPAGYFVNTLKVSPRTGTVWAVIASVAALAALALEFFMHVPKVEKRVDYYPPPGLCPAEIGVIIDDTVNNRDLISLILWWAQDEYISITEEPGKHTGLLKKGDDVCLRLTRLKNLPKNAPDYQKTLFKALFRKGSSVCLDDLSNDTVFGDSFNKAKSQLEHRFSGERKLTEGTGDAIITVMVMSLMLLAAFTYTSGVTLTENFIYALFLAACTIYTGLMMCYYAKQDHGRLHWLLIVLGLIISYINFHLCVFEEDSIQSPVLMAVCFALCFAACIFAKRFIKPTEYKLRYIGALRGFKDFVSTADMPILNSLLEKDTNYYYEILPYAMAFGLMGKWSKRFEGISMAPPTWYSSSVDGSDYLWNLNSFSNNIERSISSPISSSGSSAAAAAAESSSGGSSGGGGGGGGGGSW